MGLRVPLPPPILRCVKAGCEALAHPESNYCPEHFPWRHPGPEYDTGRLETDPPYQIISWFVDHPEVVREAGWLCYAAGWAVLGIALLGAPL
jgi:hypothetical protein